MKFETYLTKLILLLSQVKASNLYLGECDITFADNRETPYYQIHLMLVFRMLLPIYQGW